MTISIKNQSYDTFFEDSLSSFEQQLESLFKTPRKKDSKGNYEKRVFRINGDNALYEMVKGVVSNKGSFPFITTRLGGWAPNTEGYNTYELKRKGIPVKLPQKSGEDLKYITMHPEAIITTMQVNFVCKNEADAIFFSKRWYDSIRNGYFDYQLMVYNNPFEIKVRGQPDITFPDPAEIAQDTGNLYLVETSGAELHNYIMTTETKPAIKRYTVKGYNGYPSTETLIDRTRTEQDVKDDPYNSGNEWIEA